MTPDARIALRQQLKRDEGTGITKNGHFMPYPCTSGKTTIGFGHNLQDNGLKSRFVEMILDDDIEDAFTDLVTRCPWVEVLDPARQAVLVNMMFNLGAPRLMGFRRMLKALHAKDYEGAAVEMLASSWAEQVGDRALRLADQLRTGHWR
jgi:lysozyme